MNTQALNRRSMLLGLAAASTAAATQPDAAIDPEAPELLKLAERLPSATQAYVDAREAVAWIIADWGPHWPVAPAEAVYFGGNAQEERDIGGTPIQRPCLNGKNPDLLVVHRIGAPELFESARASYKAEADRKAKTKSKRGMKFNQLWADRMAAAIEPSREYWAEVERIKQASGIDHAKAEQEATRDALRDLIDEILLFEERTVTGLIIKAEAMQAWSEVDLFTRHMDLKAMHWPQAMAATVIRQTGGAA